MEYKNTKFARFVRNLSYKPWTFEYTAAFVAFMMLYTNHVAAIASRHMAVAFKIPEDTTGIYFTKLFGFRGFLLLIGSLATYILKWFISESNIIFTLIFSSLIMLSRFCALILIHGSKNLAFDIYNFYIVEGIAVGLFQLTFYSLTPEYSSLLSLCFKLSKITVFSIQLIMDFTMYNSPLLMIKIHFWIIFFLTFVSTVFWFYYCIFKNRNNINAELVPIEADENLTMSYMNIVNKVYDNNYKGYNVMAPEPGFWTHLRNCISPLFMSIVTLVMNNMISPGLLPYALLERDQCHRINMAGIPMGVAGCFVIHVLKKNVKSLNDLWTWHWHVFWVFAIPPAIVFILTFVALHTDSAIGRSIYNSQSSVLAMAMMFFFFHPLVETLGFVGVVSNVRYLGKVMEKGLKVISTNQFLGYIVGFITYKVSVGYNVILSMKDLHPGPNVSALPRFWFWFSSSFSYGFMDFVNEFRLNIKDYI